MSRTLSVPTGVALTAGTETGADPKVTVEKILPPRLLELLEDRLRHRSKVAWHSHSIEFKQAVSLVGCR